MSENYKYARKQTKWGHIHEQRTKMIIPLITDSFQISLSIIGGTNAIIAGVVFLGAVFPWAQWKGALCGVTVGIALVAWINIGTCVFNYIQLSLVK